VAAQAVKKEPGTALELVRPEQRALMQTASDIGVLVNRGGLAVIDLSSPEILDNYNVLAPTRVMVQANPNFTPSIAIVKFDVKRGSTYPLEKRWDGRTKQEIWKVVALGKLELLQIAKAMGLRVLQPDIKMQGRDIIITAAVQERDVDGTWVTHYGSQMWIHDDEYERTVAECPEKRWEGSGQERGQVELTQEDKDAWIAKNWLQRKKFSLRMTETKALEAAIRFAGEIPTKFAAEDLDKPFIIVRYTFTPDPSDIRIVLAQIEAGDAAAKALFGAPLSDPDLKEVRQMLGDGRDPRPSSPVTDPRTGLEVDPETGVVEGTCLEDQEEEAPPAAEEGHGQRPTDDREIPRGKYVGRQLSDVCKDDPAYARQHFLKAPPPLGVLTEEWLHYWEGEPDDFRDVTF